MFECVHSRDKVMLKQLGGPRTGARLCEVAYSYTDDAVVSDE